MKKTKQRFRWKVLAKNPVTKIEITLSGTVHAANIVEAEDVVRRDTASTLGTKVENIIVTDINMIGGRK